MCAFLRGVSGRPLDAFLDARYSVALEEKGVSVSASGLLALWSFLLVSFFLFASLIFLLHNLVLFEASIFFSSICRFAMNLRILYDSALFLSDVTVALEFPFI